RETLVTTVLDARPEQVMMLSQSTWLPLIAALTTGLFFLGFLIKVYSLAALGALLTLGVLLVWLWTTGERRAPDKLDAGRGLTLPVQHAAERGPGWWGTLITVLADASLFFSLVFAYFYLWLASPQWPPGGHGHGLLWPTVAGALLAVSWPVMELTRSANRRGSLWGLRLGLILAWLLGLGFLIIQVWVLWDYGIAPWEHAYASLVHTLTGFHLLHLLIALLMGGFVLVRSGFGYGGRHRPQELNVTLLFWNYTVLQGLVVFAVVHLFPRLS
ncbi:MAG: cytochrome ubiquinol oxidase subunit I, partial [Candidatus Competibacteraceae bacterium]|nr:cytochrome ubiquinol oxidase subunit I [Candidatus Competibacteraceae bacterium]